jgi:hypothetical protein
MVEARVGAAAGRGRRGRSCDAWLGSCVYLENTWPADNPMVRERWSTNCNQWVVAQKPKVRGLGLGGVVLIAAFAFAIASVTAYNQGDESRASVLAIGGAVAVGALLFLREIAAATGTRCPICRSKWSLRGR